ncbi:MAG: aminotransferase class I/II-fold pyridoxal phosphate-dependent enzyme [Myxococcales bacterium]|nr:aminotransferase class I/II-fold pyridoxal phosphate-dependent enzyme [Myxococcales bacterium]
MGTGKRAIDTELVHAGEAAARAAGSVVPPIYQSAMYVMPSADGDSDYHDIRYIRLNNSPNHTLLADKLAAVCGAEAALVASSGMAAITSALLSHLQHGEHVIVQDCVYGGTHSFIHHDMVRMGISHDVVDGADPDSWKGALRGNTRVIYVEAISNPLMRVPELEAVTRFAAEHGLVSMIDATFATPINLRPAELGFDLELHSCTKYMGGHSDVVAGAVIGKASHVARAKRSLDHLGGCLDPHACFLLTRGLKTLGLRVRQQCHSAGVLARAIAESPHVARVNYPGLVDHPDHARATRLFDGFGGMLSFELAGGLAQAERLLGALTLPLRAPSLGGPETLVTRPARTSHAGLTPAERAAAGIADGLVRVSVGIEGTDDIVSDFVSALDTL